MDNMYKEPDLSKVEAIYNVVQNENVNKDAYDIAKKFLEQIGADTSKYSQVDFSLDEMKETIREYDKKNNTKVFDNFQSEYDKAFDSKRKALDGYKEQAEIAVNEAYDIINQNYKATTELRDRYERGNENPQDEINNIVKANSDLEKQIKTQNDEIKKLTDERDQIINNSGNSDIDTVIADIEEEIAQKQEELDNLGDLEPDDPNFQKKQDLLNEIEGLETRKKGFFNTKNKIENINKNISDTTKSINGLNDKIKQNDYQMGILNKLVDKNKEDRVKTIKEYLTKNRRASDKLGKMTDTFHSLWPDFNVKEQEKEQEKDSKEQDSSKSMKMPKMNGGMSLADMKKLVDAAELWGQAKADANVNKIEPIQVPKEYNLIDEFKKDIFADNITTQQAIENLDKYPYVDISNGGKILNSLAKDEKKKYNALLKYAAEQNLNQDRINSTLKDIFGNDFPDIEIPDRIDDDTLSKINDIFYEFNQKADLTDEQRNAFENNFAKGVKYQTMLERQKRDNVLGKLKNDLVHGGLKELSNIEKTLRDYYNEVDKEKVEALNLEKEKRDKEIKDAIAHNTGTKPLSSELSSQVVPPGSQTPPTQNTNETRSHNKQKNEQHQDHVI